MKTLTKVVATTSLLFCLSAQATEKPFNETSSVSAIKAQTAMMVKQDILQTNLQLTQNLTNDIQFSLKKNLLANTDKPLKLETLIAKSSVNKSTPKNGG